MFPLEDRWLHTTHPRCTLSRPRSSALVAAGSRSLGVDPTQSRVTVRLEVLVVAVQLVGLVR
jgi:hypothetical protein